jgi:GNAT superfamily N-acetyltransferase
MRANEFINETQELDEIERLRPDDYEGGKYALYDKQVGKQLKKLPGGSGLLYSTSEGRFGGTDIKLWDPNGKDFLAQKERGIEPKPVRGRGESRFVYDRRLWDWQRAQKDLNTPGQLIGKLSVSTVYGFPLKGAVQVDTITVDEDYRGGGIAKALYGIVLTIMKRPLLAGGSQTPGGRKNWVSLASIPGVEMKGYIIIDEEDLDTRPNPYSMTTPAKANKNIDTIMGELGGQYIGKGRYEDEYFAFDVKPNTTGTELEAYVDTKLSKVYGGYDSSTGLYAIWTGQA